MMILEQLEDLPNFDDLSLLPYFIHLANISKERF